MKRPLIRKLYINLLKKKRLRKGSLAYSQTIQSAKSLGPRVVVIGGGTGLSTMLRGLKKYTQNITAIVTVADDGGSSGVIREELGMLPPGDIRNCITALANAEPTMIDLLNYRFSEGGLKGQSFGNLFLAALNGISPSFEDAVARMNEVLAVTGKVVPVTTANINLEAVFEDGSKILGESKIFSHKKEHNCRIVKVRLVPEHPPALKTALEAIEQAEIIILGPGSLYTSVIPNLLVDGISDALVKSDALKIYIMNIMTQDGETEGYTAYDHIKALISHSQRDIFDVCIYNNKNVDKSLMDKYKLEDAEPVLMDRAMVAEMGIKTFGYPLISKECKLARHDPDLLAKAIFSVFNETYKREGIYGAYDKLIIEHEV